MSERVPTTNFSNSWIRVDQTTDPSFYAGLLEATRAQSLDEARRDPQAVFAPLDLRAGLRVLDVGCGTGDYLRIMAPLVAPGAAIGIDLSATLIARGQQQTSAHDANLSLRVADTYDLPFPMPASTASSPRRYCFIWPTRGERSRKCGVCLPPTDCSRSGNGIGTAPVWRSPIENSVVDSRTCCATG